MRNRAILIATLLLVPCAGLPSAQAQQPNQPQPTQPQPAQAPPSPGSVHRGFAEVAKQALPSIVTLFSVEHVFTRPSRTSPEATAGAITPLGSGVVVDENGRVATPLSLLGDADDIRATLADGRTVEALLIGRDAGNDLAILQLGDGAKPPPLRFAEPQAVQMGDWAIVLGRPAPQAPRLAAGVLSAPPGQVLWVDGGARGLAGGALLAADGTGLGIAATLQTSFGDEMTIGIPGRAVRDALEKIAKAVAAGQPARLGVQVQPLTDQLARALGLDDTDGALVAYVASGTPAAQAGIRPGDVILSLGGANLEDPRDLPAMLAMSDPSKPLQIELWRERKSQTVELNVAAAPAPATATVPSAAPGAQAQPPGGAAKPDDQQQPLGIVVAPLTPELREQIGLRPDSSGVVVVGVRGGSIAAGLGLQPGDVIVEVAGSPVGDPAKLVELIREGRKKGDVLLRVNRHGSFGFVVLPA